MKISCGRILSNALCTWTNCRRHRRVVKHFRPWTGSIRCTLDQGNRSSKDTSFGPTLRPPFRVGICQMGRAIFRNEKYQTRGPLKTRRKIERETRAHRDRSVNLFNDSLYEYVRTWYDNWAPDFSASLEKSTKRRNVIFT